MAINFDALPKEKPTGSLSVPTAGFHGVTIETAEIKTASSGNDYLELKLKLDSGEVVYDRVMESDKPALQYKLGRLLTACKIPLVGALTLKDLGTVIKGKKVVADITVKPDTYQREKGNADAMKAEVDIFSNDVFYPIEELAALTGNNTPSTPPPTTGSY